MGRAGGKMVIDAHISLYACMKFSIIKNLNVFQVLYQDTGLN